MEVTIFEAPADELLVETIDLFVVVPPESDVIAGEPWPHRHVCPLIRLGTQPLESYSPRLRPRYEPLDVAMEDRARVDACRGGLIEPRTVTTDNPAQAACGEVLPQMVAGQNAVAIGEEDVGSRRGRHALVAAACEAEAVVLVGGEAERKCHVAGEGCEYLQRLVAGAVVGHHDLEAVGDTLLNGERRQAPFEVPGTFECGNDDRDIHSAPPIGTTRRVIDIL